MAFGGKVQDGPRLVLRQQAGDQLGIPNITLHEDVPRVALQRCQRFQVAGIGQLVEVDDGLVGLGQPVEDEVGTDEAGCAGNKKGHKVMNRQKTHQRVRLQMMGWHKKPQPVIRALSQTQ